MTGDEAKKKQGIDPKDVKPYRFQPVPHTACDLHTFDEMGAAGVTRRIEMQDSILPVAYFTEPLRINYPLTVTVDHIMEQAEGGLIFGIGVVTCNPSSFRDLKDKKHISLCNRITQREICGKNADVLIYDVNRDESSVRIGLKVVIERTEAGFFVKHNSFLSPIPDSNETFKDVSRNAYPFVLLNGCVSSIKILDPAPVVDMEPEVAAEAPEVACEAVPTGSSSACDTQDVEVIPDNLEEVNVVEQPAAAEIVIEKPLAPEPVPAADPVVEPTVPCDTEPVAQPVAEPVAEPVQPVAGPVVEPVVQPAVEPIVQPVVEPVAQSVIDEVALPVAQPVTGPVINVPIDVPDEPVSMADAAIQTDPPSGIFQILAAQSTSRPPESCDFVSSGDAVCREICSCVMCSPTGGKDPVPLPKSSAAQPKQSPGDLNSRDRLAEVRSLTLEQIIKRLNSATKSAPAGKATSAAAAPEPEPQEELPASAKDLTPSVTSVTPVPSQPEASSHTSTAQSSHVESTNIPVTPQPGTSSQMSDDDDPLPVTTNTTRPRKKRRKKNVYLMSEEVKKKKVKKSTTRNDLLLHSLLSTPKAASESAPQDSTQVTPIHRKDHAYVIRRRSLRNIAPDDDAVPEPEPVIEPVPEPVPEPVQEVELETIRQSLAEARPVVTPSKSPSVTPRAAPVSSTITKPQKSKKKKARKSNGHFAKKKAEPEKKSPIFGSPVRNPQLWAMDFFPVKRGLEVKVSEPESAPKLCLPAENSEEKQKWRCGTNVKADGNVFSATSSAEDVDCLIFGESMPHNSELRFRILEIDPKLQGSLSFGLMASRDELPKDLRELIYSESVWLFKNNLIKTSFKESEEVILSRSLVCRLTMRVAGGKEETIRQFIDPNIGDPCPFFLLNGSVRVIEIIES